jgi:hypothetical protein
VIAQTVYMICPSLTAFSVRHGTSEAARFILEESERSMAPLQNSVSLGRRHTFEELLSVYEECNTPGWDGESAVPIVSATYVHAYRLIEVLPLGIQLPSISAETDGHLTLEWYRSPRRAFSVSISSEGELHWAAFMGARKVAGTEPFLGEPPVEILRRIREVYT